MGILTAEEFISACTLLMKNREFVYVALSGGNTPKVFFEMLLKYHKLFFGWNRIKFFWVDERCVSPADKESNYGEAKRILFDNLNSFLKNNMIPAENIIRIKGENNPGSEAVRYSEILIRELPVENSYPKFDIILLGIGDDGHTASIFPGMLDLMDSDKYCAAVKHPQTSQSRVTLTGSVINNSNRIMFLVSGKNKAKVVSEIVNEKGSFEKYPAYYVKPSGGDLYFYFDEDAAEYL